jgi:flagellar biosynthetic protein FlhB
MAEQDSDRTEQATRHKLDEARKRGSVARSPDMTAVAMLAGLAIAVYASAWDGLRTAMRMQQAMFARTSSLDWTPAGMAHWLGGIALGMLGVLGPLFMVLVVVAVLANFVQVGPVFTTHPLKPDLDRLNPASGIKRVLSMRTLYEAGKSVLKLIVLAWIAWGVLHAAVPHLLVLMQREPRSYLQALLAMGAGLLVKLMLGLGLLAVLDLLFTRWEFGRRMRMSKRDIRDEHKNREGDPRIRSRIRQLRKEMLKRSQSARKVASADVLITNPTHLAVAVCYEHGKSLAPQVVAKGAGDLALKMREIAARHNIPIVQNRALARALFREVDHEGFVPEQHYPQVAKIMVWVYAMRAARRTSRKVN